MSEINDNIKTVEGESVESESDEAYYEIPSPHEDIAASLNALYSLDFIGDEQLYSKMMQKRFTKIKEYAFDIIHEQLKYIHSCVFYDEGEEKEKEQKGKEEKENKK